MKTLIVANMAWNAFFILMAASEMLGLTQVHEGLPWYLKWWWVIALAIGNLGIHIAMLAKVDTLTADGNLRQRDAGAARDWAPP
jgi:hypothetical protein